MKKQYTFEELGYFMESDCKAIKDRLQGYSYMKFDVSWCNMAGNCILNVATDYDADPQEIKNFFIHCVFSSLRRA